MTVKFKWSLGFIFLSTPKDFLPIAFRERGRERNLDTRKKHWSVAPYMPRVGILRVQTGGHTYLHMDREHTRNLAMFPDCESNLKPFDYEMLLQPTEPHQPGQSLGYFY